MLARTAAWTIEALRFEEILTPVVESFLNSEEDRAFDWSRSAIRQCMTGSMSWAIRCIGMRC
jgi:hypothetical protein